MGKCDANSPQCKGADRAACFKIQVFLQGVKRPYIEPWWNRFEQPNMLSVAVAGVTCLMRDVKAYLDGLPEMVVPFFPVDGKLHNPVEHTLMAAVSDFCRIYCYRRGYVTPYQYPAGYVLFIKVDEARDVGFAETHRAMNLLLERWCAFAAGKFAL